MSIMKFPLVNLTLKRVNNDYISNATKKEVKPDKTYQVIIVDIEQTKNSTQQLDIKNNGVIDGFSIKAQNHYTLAQKFLKKSSNSNKGKYLQHYNKKGNKRAHLNLNIIPLHFENLKNQNPDIECNEPNVFINEIKKHHNTSKSRFALEIFAKVIDRSKDIGKETKASPSLDYFQFYHSLTSTLEQEDTKEKHYNLIKNVFTCDVANKIDSKIKSNTHNFNSFHREFENSSSPPLLDVLERLKVNIHLVENKAGLNSKEIPERFLFKMNSQASTIEIFDLHDPASVARLIELNKLN